MKRPLKGRRQSSDRGGLRALVAAVEAVQGQVDIVTDNMYVKDKRDSIKMGGGVKGAHQDLWGRFRDNTRVLRCIRRFKVHLEVGEALSRGITYEDWYGNERADSLAKEFADRHGHTSQECAEARGKQELVSRCQEHLLASSVRYLGFTKIE